MQENYVIKWGQFDQNFCQNLRDLRHEADFLDVTLAFDDGNQIEAPKLILSACSPVWQGMLKRSKQKHAIIFMTGVGFKSANFLIDFLYSGEVSVPQSEVSEFLATANRLKVKGLAQEIYESQENLSIYNVLEQEQCQIKSNVVPMDSTVIEQRENIETGHADLTNNLSNICDSMILKNDDNLDDTATRNEGLTDFAHIDADTFD